MIGTADIIVSGWKVVAKSLLSSQGLASLRERLTIPIKVYDDGKATTFDMELFREEGGLFYVPREEVLTFHLAATIQAKGVSDTSLVYLDREYPPMLDIDNPKWPHQRKAVDQCVATLKHKLELSDNIFAGGILVSPTGSGKTLMAVEIAREMNLKCLVTVHKDYLAKQWEDASKLVFGEEAGRIQGGRVETDGPMTVAMVQSLTGGHRDYSDTFDQFGMIIVDEVNRIGAQVWSQVAPMFKAAVRLGVSAELERTDGAMPVFFKHIGEIIHEVTEEEVGRDQPTIYIRNTGYRLNRNHPGDGWVFRGKQPDINRTMSWLSSRVKRNEFIVSVINHAASEGRKLLVLAHTHKHLDKLRAWTDEKYSTSKFSSGEDLKAAVEAQVIFSTYAMAKEAVDIPTVDVLVMATPIAKPIQAVGRATRVVEGKPPPVIVDFVDEKIGFLAGWAKGRVRQYEEKGYQVVMPKQGE